MKPILLAVSLFLGPALLFLSFALPSPWFWLCLAAGLAMTGPALFVSFHAMYHGELQYQRDQKGLCIHGGYDLRASTHRCPECGRPTNTRPDFD